MIDDGAAAARDGRDWLMRQTWHDLLFAHWPVAADALSARVPPPLELDTFDGRAWVGVVPFRIGGIRLRGFPPLPGLASFAELNVRTYVRYGGYRGVYFFSLDAASSLAVAGARLTYLLPYFLAHMSVGSEGDLVAYASRRADRRGAAADFVARYAPVGPVAKATPGSLDEWLTARTSLFVVDRHGRVHRADVEHGPWPLQPARAEIAANTMAAAVGVALPASRPLLHFSRRLDVRVGRLRPHVAS